MTKKKGFLIGGAALVGVLGLTAFQSFADQTEPIERVQEEQVQVASETEEKNNGQQEILAIEEAKERALNEYEGKLIEIQLDRDDGRLVYEIELVTDKEEIELDMDAVTGEIIEVDKDGIDSEKQAKLSEDLLSIDKAKEIALAEFDGKVIEIELDEDDGRYLYEVELRDGNKEAEMDIDARTGEIIEFELD